MLSKWVTNTTKADTADATIGSSDYGIRPGTVPTSFPTVELIGKAEVFAVAVHPGLDVEVSTAEFEPLDCSDTIELTAHASWYRKVTPPSTTTAFPIDSASAALGIKSI